MVVPVKAVPLSLTKVWFLSVTISFVLWLLPLICGKYTSVTYPYIAVDDIAHELVTDEEPAKDGLPLCPPVSSYLESTVRLLNSEVDALSDDEIVKRYGVQPGGVWQPQHCHSRYHVSISL